MTPAKSTLAVMLFTVTSCVSTAVSESSTTERVCANRTGTVDGFFFTFWKDGGDACMALGDSGHYATRFDLLKGRNLVAGMGWRTGSQSRKVGYRANRFDPGTNSYLTLYGWTLDLLVEYYVVDDWGTGFRPPGEDATLLGTLASDGGTYEIYRTQRIEKPSIQGTQTFSQYWSVRTERRGIGTDAAITFANHVEAWRRLGMELGRMNYQVMATEGFASKGGSDINVWEE